MRRIDLKKANVARSNTIRDINRQIVLNYVRERGPISRAEIAHETALQRSTVSLIVEELRVDGLIEEVSGESTGGRPPILLSLRTADAVAIGVDLGTTRTIVATSDLAGRVLEQETFETDPDAKKTTKEIIDRARRLIRRNNGTIEGIGISLARTRRSGRQGTIHSHFQMARSAARERNKRRHRIARDDGQRRERCGAG